MKPAKSKSIKLNQKGAWKMPFCRYIFVIFIYLQMVQFISVTQSCLTLCDPVDCSTPGFPVHHQLPELTQTHVHRVSDAIQSSYPLSSPFHLSQNQGLFQWVSSSLRWWKYWCFSFNISHSNKNSGLISFRIDWLNLKSLLQHHSSKASILQCSAFFIVQLSYPYMTTGKTIALTRQTFVGKVMSLLFNMLSRLVIAFLPRSKHLLISWLQSPPEVILELKKIKSVTGSIVSPSICHDVTGPDAMILVFWMLSFKSTFSLSSFTFIKRLFSSSLRSPRHEGGVIRVSEVIDISPSNDWVSPNLASAWKGNNESLILPCCSISRMFL